MKTLYFSILAIFFCHFITAEECPFCKPSVLEDQTAFEGTFLRVLVDHAPVSPGHLLLIPKRHIGKAHEMSKEEWGEFSDLINRVVKTFQSRFRTDQYILLEKNGSNAGQTVPHVHFHLLPMPSNALTAVVKEVIFQKIFGKRPSQLSREQLLKEVVLYRSYLSNS